MSITITQLRSFLAVARTGSVSGAADELVVTQPSVSAAVTALSREVGVSLTERVGRNIRLSAAGSAFEPYAADVIGLLEQGRREAREAAEVADRALSIAAVTTAGEYLVPALMRAFGDRHPDIALTAEVGNRGRVLGLVRDHEVDVGIGGRPPEDGRIVGTRLIDNEIVLIAPQDDPLAGATVDTAELRGRTWLLREQGSGTRTMCERFLEKHDLAPKILTLGSNGAIKHAVRAGLGVALQSRVAVELELRTALVATISLKDALPARHWYVLRSSVGVLREPAREFIAFIESDEALAALERARLNQ